MSLAWLVGEFTVAQEKHWRRHHESNDPTCDQGLAIARGIMICRLLETIITPPETVATDNRTCNEPKQLHSKAAQNNIELRQRQSQYYNLRGGNHRQTQFYSHSFISITLPQSTPPKGEYLRINTFWGGILFVARPNKTCPTLHD